MGGPSGESNGHALVMAKGKTAVAPITPWLKYFVEGMAHSFEAVLSRRAESAPQGTSDHSALLRILDPKQSKALALFQES